MITQEYIAEQKSWTYEFQCHVHSSLIQTDLGYVKLCSSVLTNFSLHPDLWRRLSIYVVIPCLVLAGINAYNLWNEHWEHWEHMPPLEERVEYPYQNIRTRNYFWGDGDKVRIILFRT